MPVRLIGEPHLWYPERAKRGRRLYPATMLQDALRRRVFVSRFDPSKCSAGTGRCAPRPKRRKD